MDGPLAFSSVLFEARRKIFAWFVVVFFLCWFCFLLFFFVLVRLSGGLSSFLPYLGIGWAMYFHEYVFVKKDWAKDGLAINAFLRSIRETNTPAWIGIFPEGLPPFLLFLSFFLFFAFSMSLHLSRHFC
jgi:1-acyl-sn-glycerol-3-phosphate acyltransferase